MRRAAIWLLLLAVGLAFLLVSQTLREEGFYSPDGSEVFFIAWETSGLVLGFGFECLSPPAYGFVWKDRLTLLRLRVEDGSVEVAKTWPGSPLGRTVVAHVSRTPVHRAFHPPAMGRPERAAISSPLADSAPTDGGSLLLERGMEIDRPGIRASTFSDEDVVVHIGFADPICSKLAFNDFEEWPSVQATHSTCKTPFAANRRRSESPVTSGAAAWRAVAAAKASA